MRTRGPCGGYINEHMAFEFGLHSQLQEPEAAGSRWIDYRSAWKCGTRAVHRGSRRCSCQVDDLSRRRLCLPALLLSSSRRSRSNFVAAPRRAELSKFHTPMILLPIWASRLLTGLGSTMHRSKFELRGCAQCSNYEHNTEVRASRSSPSHVSLASPRAIPIFLSDPFLLISISMALRSISAPYPPSSYPSLVSHAGFVL